MVQDSTGRGRAVFYCFMKTETTASIKQLLEVWTSAVLLTVHCRVVNPLLLHELKYIFQYLVLLQMD